MKVQFRQTFFGPNGSRYRPKIEYDVPDSWKDKLPKGATIVEDEKPSTGKSVKATASAAAGTASVGAKL